MYVLHKYFNYYLKTTNMLLSVIEFFFVKATIMHQFVIDANNSWIDHFMFIVFVYILSVDFPFPSQKHRMSFINNVEF